MNDHLDLSARIGAREVRQNPAYSKSKSMICGALGNQGLSFFCASLFEKMGSGIGHRATGMRHSAKGMWHAVIVPFALCPMPHPPCLWPYALCRTFGSRVTVNVTYEVS
jgi:hypothetical protein